MHRAQLGYTNKRTKKEQMKDEPKLGTTPKGDEGRDAVHIAIVPLRAAELLHAGSPVRINSDNQAENCSPREAIGVVDPFMQAPACVHSGEWFWLCLYPKTVTGLRHVWEHPAFPKSETAPQIAGDNKAASEEWLKVYVKAHCPYWSEDIPGYTKARPDGGYSQFIGCVKDERRIFFHGTDCHSIEEVDDAENLFHHLSVVLNRRIDASYFTAFTCSC